MRLTFVVHTSTPTKTDAAGKPLVASVVLRPVVNEEDTNREWSPGAVPTGELELRVTAPAMIEKLREGQRLDLEVQFPKPALTPPAPDAAA